MRLIDADKFVEVLIEIVPDLRNLSTKTVGKALDITPTVDAVSVIRCKDCKYYQRKSLTDDEWKWCMQWHNYTDENVYCSLAERKEDD